MGPDGDRERQDALLDFDIIDTPADAAFDDIAFIAAQTCGAPAALVNLLGLERQWFRGRFGFDGPEAPLEQSICRIDIDRPGLLVIPDASADPRTQSLPQVAGGPAIRFYAGAPLVSTRGVTVGRLCVIDPAPHPEGLTPEQERMLSALARQVVAQLEQRRTIRIAGDFVQLQSCLIAVSERIRRSVDISDMTSGTAKIVGHALALDRAGYGTVDAGTEHVTIEPDWTADGVTSIAGTHRFADFGSIRDELAKGEPLVIHDVLTDPRTATDPRAMTALDIGSLVNMPVRERGRTTAVFIVQSRSPRRWHETELAFLRTVADRIEAGVARFRSEEQQRTVNAEISHRLKNMLAMVQAIANQTLRRVVERPPIEAFERRLMALSTGHDVLMQSSWSSAQLRDVLGAVLATFGYDGRIHVDGQSIALGSRAALSFSLLIHELATNAVKYGSLSNETGSVAIEWAVSQNGSEQELTVGWTEHGGPPTIAPSRKGFGSRLIGLGLVGTGGVTIRYEPTGLQVTMSASLSDLAQS